jgi:co-chaperonin GroES (HSP10)
MDSAIQEMVNAFPGRALNYNVVLRQIANKNVSENNLDLTNALDKNEKFKKGIVVSIGTECPKGDIELGSEVMYDSYKASKVTLDTIEYEIVYFADLIHVL